MEKIWWLPLIVSLLSLLLNYQRCEGRKLHSALGSPSANYVTHLQLPNSKMLPIDPLIGAIAVKERENILEDEKKKQLGIEETLHIFKNMKENLKGNPYELFDNGKQLANYMRDETFDARWKRIVEEARVMWITEPEVPEEKVERQEKTFISYKEKRGTIIGEIKNALEGEIQKTFEGEIQKASDIKFWPDQVVAQVTTEIDAALVTMKEKTNAIATMWDSGPCDQEALKLRKQSTDGCVKELANVGKIVDRMERGLQEEIILEPPKLTWSKERNAIIQAFFKGVASYRKGLFNFQKWAEQLKD